MTSIPMPTTAATTARAGLQTTLDAHSARVWRYKVGIGVLVGYAIGLLSAVAMLIATS